MRLSLISRYVLALLVLISASAASIQETDSFQVSYEAKGSVFRNRGSHVPKPSHHVHSLSLPSVYPFDSKWMKKKLLPGDIIFFKVDPNYFTLKTAILGQDGEEIDYTILTLQKAFNQLFNLGYSDQATSFVHVGIYLGNGEILESSPVNKLGIRKLSIDDPDFALLEGDPEGYKIYRIQSEKLRLQVARVSNEFSKFIASEKELFTDYSYKSAFLSLFPNSAENFASSHLYLPKKGAHEPLILDHMFCSYLVAWIMQAAEYQLDKSLSTLNQHTAINYSPSNLYHILSNSSLFRDIGSVVS